MIFYLILAAGILFFWKRLYRLWWSRGLDAYLYFPEKTVYAGEQAELTEVLTNRKRLPLAEVELGFRVPKGIRFLDAENIVVSDFIYKRDIFSLRGMEAVTRRYRMDCAKRGRYQISQITLKSWSFFRTSRYGTEMNGSDELTVYAKRVDVSGILSTCDTILGTLESAKRLYEDPFTLASVREYTLQDPMKNINWKASARMNNLMVNTFSSVRSEQFFVFLDVSDQMIWKEEELVELGISAAASLCQRLIRRGLEVGFAANTNPPSFFEPGRGGQRLQQIEQFLTQDFSEKDTVRLEETARLSVKKKDRICVFISKEWDQERGEKMKKQLGANLPVILVIPVREDGRKRLRVKVL